MCPPLRLRTLLGVLLVFPVLGSARMPEVRAKLKCGRGEQKQPVYMSADSSEVLGYVNCGDEVVLADHDFRMSESGGALFLEPVSTRYWSSKHNFLTHIAFGRPNGDGWVDAEAEILPDQRFRVVIVGQPVDKTVCDNHGGFEKVEPARTGDPLNLFGQFVVCKDRSRILQR